MITEVLKVFGKIFEGSLSDVVWRMGGILYFFSFVFFAGGMILVWTLTKKGYLLTANLNRNYLICITGGVVGAAGFLLAGIISIELYMRHWHMHH